MTLESQAQLLEFGFHGFCPNTIALFVEVQGIRHDILGALAIRIQKVIAQIKIMNAFAIGKTTNDLVDALIDDATAIMEGASPGEDAQQQHLGARILPGNVPDSLSTKS